MSTLVFGKKEHEAQIQGDLNFENVAVLLPQGKVLIGKNKSLSIDLRSVTHCDSAGLALLTAWVRYAKQCQTQLTFIRVPSQLYTMAGVCGLERILPFHQ